MKQPPAFQFYASDYLSSSKVQRMTLAAEGAYIRLLAYNWQDGSIPADIPTLAKLCKCRPQTMESLWNEYLAECFTVNGQPGRLVNPRLEEVRKKLLDHKAERSESGKKGAAKRWNEDGSANGSAINARRGKQKSDTQIAHTDGDHNPIEQHGKSPQLIDSSKHHNGSAIEQPIAKNSSPSPSPSSSLRPPIVPHSNASQYPPDFEEFWMVYPKHVGKGEALKSWKKIRPSTTLVSIIVAAVLKQKVSPDWLREHGQYIPSPSKWLNQSRWDDDVPLITQNIRGVEI